MPEPNNHDPKVVPLRPWDDPSEQERKDRNADDAKLIWFLAVAVGVVLFGWLLTLGPVRF